MIKKIDIHSHMIPKSLPDFENEFGYKGFPKIESFNDDYSIMQISGEGTRKIKADCWDPSIRIKDCIKNNVIKQVVSTMPVLFSYWAPKRDALEVSKILNNHFIDLINTFPEKFDALATIPMQAPDLAIKEIERCKKDGISGVQIGSNINGECISSKRFTPIFQSIAENNMCVLIHPWDVYGKDLLGDYWLQWLVGMPSETSRVICSLIFIILLQKYQNM